VALGLTSRARVAGSALAGYPEALMSSSDKKDKPPQRATPSFDPAMMTTLPLSGTVASPFGRPAPGAQGFGVEDARRGLEKGERARTPAGLLEKTEVMSPEERKHGRPSRPKKADSPSKIAKRGAPTKIAKPKAPAPNRALTKTALMKTAAMKTAAMKTASLPGPKRRPAAPARYPGLVETTERMAHAKRKPAGVILEPEVLKPAPRLQQHAAAVAPAPQRANAPGGVGKAGGGLDAAFARFLELADAALDELTLPPG
jgi:hypothetical protein